MNELSELRLFITVTGSALVIISVIMIDSDVFRYIVFGTLFLITLSMYAGLKVLEHRFGAVGGTTDD